MSSSFPVQNDFQREHAPRSIFFAILACFCGQTKPAISRKVEQFSPRTRLENFFFEVGNFPRFCLRFHPGVPSPFEVFVKPSGQLGQLWWRQLFDGYLDFSDCAQLESFSQRPVGRKLKGTGL